MVYVHCLVAFLFDYGLQTLSRGLGLHLCFFGLWWVMRSSCALRALSGSSSLLFTSYKTSFAITLSEAVKGLTSLLVSKQINPVMMSNVTLTRDTPSPPHITPPRPMTHDYTPPYLLGFQPRQYLLRNRLEVNKCNETGCDIACSNSHAFWSFGHRSHWPGTVFARDLEGRWCRTFVGSVQRSIVAVEG